MVLWEVAAQLLFGCASADASPRYDIYIFSLCMCCGGVSYIRDAGLHKAYMNSNDGSRIYGEDILQSAFTHF